MRGGKAAAYIAGAILTGAVAAALALTVQACGGKAQTPTTTATVVQTVIKDPGTGATVTGENRDRTQARTGSTEPAGSDDIRAVDWDTVVGSQPMIRDVEDVIYSDLTGDGREDALVLVRVEGSGAYLDYYVYQLNGDELVNLFQQIEVSHGKVELGPLPFSFVESTAVYGADDPNCCPSNIMYTTYQWSASAKVFTAVTVEMAPNPQASAFAAV